MLRREQHPEFVAADSTDAVRLSDGRQQRLCNGAQHNARVTSRNEQQHQQSDGELQNPKPLPPDGPTALAWTCIRRVTHHRSDPRNLSGVAMTS